jgi:hypothetical protein
MAAAVTGLVIEKMRNRVSVRSGSPVARSFLPRAGVHRAAAAGDEGDGAGQLAAVDQVLQGGVDPRDAGGGEADVFRCRPAQIAFEDRHAPSHGSLALAQHAAWRRAVKAALVIPWLGVAAFGGSERGAKRYRKTSLFGRIVHG